MTTAAAAPTKPYLTDEYRPTNDSLWKDVLDVAKGKRRELRIGDRTINSPNDGQGFYPWPHPNGMAWAVKQYNGFNGGWTRREAGVIARMSLGGILATSEGSFDHDQTEQLHREGFVRLSHTTGDWHYWTATYRGQRLIRASLGDELRRRMDALLESYDPTKAKDLGEWIEANFRVNSPQTPKGAKELKEQMLRLVWVLKFRVAFSSDPGAVEKARAEVAEDWKPIEQRLTQFVLAFTGEGGKVIPKELALGSNLYVNATGVDEATLTKYAKRVETVLATIKGWRRKALQGGLKIVLASPRDFRGTVGGKYKRAEDALYIRATPSILKRDPGYQSFEYIVVHEMGHRYEKFENTRDFDKAEWLTSRYSHSEGEAFAELFAIGHFGIRGNWDEAIVERFEKEMTS